MNTLNQTVKFRLSVIVAGLLPFVISLAVCRITNFILFRMGFCYDFLRFRLSLVYNILRFFFCICLYDLRLICLTLYLCKRGIFCFLYNFISRLLRFVKHPLLFYFPSGLKRLCLFPKVVSSRPDILLNFSSFFDFFRSIIVNQLKGNFITGFCLYFIRSEYSFCHLQTPQQALLNKLILAGTGDNDFTGILKPSDCRNNLLLRFFYILQAHRSHKFHIFFQHTCSTL